jgi:general secretion pathway protein J
VVDTGLAPPLQFDGQTVRLTRRSEAGIVIAAWAVRDGRWQRWTSPAYTRAEALQQGWLAAQQLLGTEPGQVRLADGAEGWQVYFFYDGNWANAQSTGKVVAPGGAPAAPRQLLPDAVRIVVALAGGALTRDVALGPTAP